MNNMYTDVYLIKGKEKPKNNKLYLSIQNMKGLD